jgi:histidine triad (HIT) family protein
MLPSSGGRLPRRKGEVLCPKADGRPTKAGMIGAMSSCLFCRIVAAEIPAKVIYQDADVLAFEDINPQAPLHCLIIPRRHIATLNDMQVEDAAIVGTMQYRAAQIARERGYADGGFRTVINCNADAGQTVFHIHLHLLAGRRLHWPPG